MQARLFAVENAAANSFPSMKNLLEDIKGEDEALVNSVSPSELAFPSPIFSKETILFFVFGLPITIEKKTGKLFFQGEEVFGFRQYLSCFGEDYNKKFQKKRLIELKRNGCVFVVNRGIDGRLFFLLFDSDSFRHFRGKPFWQASFWQNNGKAEWFEKDLHKPEKTW